MPCPSRVRVTNHIPGASYEVKGGWRGAASVAWLAAGAAGDADGVQDTRTAQHAAKGVGDGGKHALPSLIRQHGLTPAPVTRKRNQVLPPVGARMKPLELTAIVQAQALVQKHTIFIAIFLKFNSLYQLRFYLFIFLFT